MEKKIAYKKKLCFFDGAHSRVQGFVALAAWVLHPSMRQLFRIASMEVSSESSLTVKLFWQHFNECLQIVKKELENSKEIDTQYTFNPKGFMCDEAGANFKGMQDVFGLETVTHKVKTCQWHFLHQMAQKAKLTGDNEEEVMRLAHKLCKVTTVQHYKLIMARLFEIGDMFPKFMPCLKWWDSRRYHVFNVFRQFNLPGVNLAEIGNAAWKRQGKLTLVEAAKDDITTMLVQERDYINFKRGDVPPPVGRGPTDKEKASKSRKYQMEAAKQVAEMLRIPEASHVEMKEMRNPSSFIPNKGAKHKSRSKGPEGKRRKRDKSPPNFLNLLNQITAAQQIMQEQPEATPADNRLGQSKQPRAVRPLKGSALNPNYCYVTFLSGLGVRKCLGCPTPIAQVEAPFDMVFRFRAIRPFLNKKTQMWQDQIANGYCHLDLNCLRSHNPNFTTQQIHMDDQTFLQCSPGHFKYLTQAGVLKHILDNRK